jgi:hypothetical protein
MLLSLWIIFVMFCCFFLVLDIGSWLCREPLFHVRVCKDLPNYILLLKLP